MRNGWKVSKWEFKRNITNKSFLISLFITPILFIIFFTVGAMFSSSSFDENTELVNVHVYDEIGVIDDAILSHFDEEQILFHFLNEFSEEEIKASIPEEENTAYISITEDALLNGQITMYLSDDVHQMFAFQFSALEVPLRQLQLERMGLSSSEAAIAANGVAITPMFARDLVGEGESITYGSDFPPYERLVPGIFAALILFSIVITGMMIFQSASQEKKEKVAEMVLSSITPTELMQGKILGYFLLGLVQVSVWIVIIGPVLLWRIDEPLLQYLFVPELAILLLIAILGYLLFASVFVSIGATVEDMNTSSNFQGIVFMLPWTPFFLFGPILSDPSGVVAQVGTFFPITSPGVLLIRLSILEQWPWIEIIIALIVLIGSIWLFMKLAGKIFKTGILMYGKNATPQEIWKWIRQ